MKYRSSLMCLAAMLLAALVASGQSVTGSIEGTVQDQTGGMLPGVQVTITNAGTNLSRTLATDERGSFRAELLPAGQYIVKASAAGFATVSTEADVLTGRPTGLRLVMKPGAVEQTITVSESAALVDVGTFDLSRNQGGRVVEEVPLFDRDILGLVTLNAGVPAPVERQFDPTARTNAYTIGGTRFRNVIFNVDGTDNNDDRGSGARAKVIPEMVQEVRTLTNVFSAQYGRGGGGVVDVILRSGSNKFHGALFEYLRNDVLNSNDFFNNAARVARYGDKRNEYGAMLSGPVRRDHTFFLLGFQLNNTRQSRPGSLVTIPNGKRLVGSLATAAGADVVSMIRTYYSLLPDTATGQLQANMPAPVDFYNWSAKLDHRLSSKDTLELRYFQDYTKGAAYSLPAVNTVSGAYRDYTYSATWRRLFNPRVINEFRTTLLHLGRLNFTAATLPDISISGYAGVGGGDNPADYRNNDLQFLDNLSWVRGRHSLLAGADIRWKQLLGYTYYQGRGGYSFTAATVAVPGYTTDALTNFQNGLANGFQQAVGDFERDIRIREFNGYLQDDWKALPNLTVNAGLRYDLQAAPRIKTLPAKIRYYSAYDPLAKKYEDLQGDHNNFAPRVGFAWDPGRKGRTAVRGGYGLIYNRLVQDDYNKGAMLQPPALKAYLLSLSPAVGPIVLGHGLEKAMQQPLAVLAVIRQGAVLPCTHSWSLGVQQAMPWSSTLEVSYVGTASRHLSEQNEYNRYDVTKYPYARFDPPAGSILLVADTAYSDYRAMQVTWRKRMARGLMMQAAWTWSKAEDIIFDAIAGSGNGRGYFGSTDASENAATVTNRFDPVTREAINTYEKGPAIFDRPHAFVLSYIYDLPKLQAHPAAGALLNGWSVSGVTNFQSGIPFNVLAGRDLSGDGVAGGDRPDIVDLSILGRSFDNPNVVVPRTAFATPAFIAPTAASPGKVGTYGTLPRNAFRRDGLNNWDFGVARKFRLKEGVGLQFRGEFFDLFNHTQFNGPVISLASSVFGQIRSAANPSRNIRLALKLSF